MIGELHATSAPPSSEQRNVPGSLEEKANVAEVLGKVSCAPVGASVVVGAVLSTVHCHVDSEDRLSLQSTARTWKV